MNHVKFCLPQRLRLVHLYIYLDLFLSICIISKEATKAIIQNIHCYIPGSSSQGIEGRGAEWSNSVCQANYYQDDTGIEELLSSF